MKTPNPITFRVITYALIPCVIIEIMVMATRKGHADFIVSENGPLEWLQFALLITSIVLLLWRANATATPQLSRLIAVFPLLAAVRELDKVFDNYVFDGAWQVTVFSIIAAAGVYIYRHRDVTWQQLTYFLGESSCGYITTAVIMTLGLSRLAGQQVFWQGVMGEAYISIVGRFVEETLELISYFILVMGAAEKVVFNTAAVSAETDMDRTMVARETGKLHRQAS